MKTYEIYKTYGLYSNEEFNELVIDIMEGDDDIENEDEAEERAIDYINELLDDELSNIQWSKINNLTYAITGNLGLWDGRKEIAPHYCKNLVEAIRKCINNIDEFIIYEDQYGNLKIDAYHHDGCNHFTIKKLISGNRDAKYLMRCVHLRKEVYGC